MKIIVLFIFITLLLFSQTMNEQIHALEYATPEKRVALMNHIKEQLITMNHKERMKTIHTLQKKLQVKHENQSHQSHSDENKLEPYERHEQSQEEHQRDSHLHQEVHQHEENREK